MGGAAADCAGVLNGVFKVASQLAACVDGLIGDLPIDFDNLKDVTQAGDRPAGGSLIGLMADDGVDKVKADRGDASLELVSLGHRPQICGVIAKRFAIEKVIEQDVGVEKRRSLIAEPSP